MALDTARMDTTTKLAVSLREGAAMLGISARTLQNYVWARRFPSRKIGRRTVVLVRDLEVFLRKDQPSPARRHRTPSPQRTEIAEAHT
jgi:predicted DNA-binding transcriptional regulator AlpA